LLKKAEVRGQRAEGNIINFRLLSFKHMSYREQFIWQKAVDLSVRCYKLTDYFPKSETYGMISQIRRCSVSVASNIAEGYGRKGKGEYIQFLHVALGSLRELDTQLIISLKVELAQAKYIESVIKDCEEMQRLMVSSINKLKNK
jgi:four helix bundle protein